VKAEQAPGNMSKRMLELQAMLEMQERLPVPPERIIDKLDISGTEKERWLQYIQQQEAAQAQQQQELAEAELSFKDREIKVDEQKNTMDFMVDLAKLKQMAEKDEKGMATKFAGLTVQEQGNILNFINNMTNTLASHDSEEPSTGGEKDGKGKQISNA
jgi:hypothetical protein